MQNPYQPPNAELISPQLDGRRQPFYLVSTNKMALLFVATTGFYSFFWFYNQWRQYKLATDKPIWPIARAFFPIFFMHSLIFAVDERLKSNQNDHNWTAPTWATLYVLSIVVSVIASWLFAYHFNSVTGDYMLEFVFLLLELYILFNVQKAINVSLNDPSGSTNSRLTAPNVFWIIIGLLIWVITIGSFAEALGWLDFGALMGRYFS